MANSVSGQDEANPVGYLSGQVGAILPIPDYPLCPANIELYFFFFINMQKKNSTNIQPSKPHAWSITLK